MKSIASILCLLITGCATNPVGAGFQKEFPYKFRPYPESPDIYNFSLNNIIDLTPYIWFPQKDTPIFSPF